MKKPVNTHCAVAVGISLILIVMTAFPVPSRAAVQRVKFQAGSSYLIVEFLRDDLVHFELSGIGPGPTADQALFTTPQVYKNDYAGPTEFTLSGQAGGTLDTADLKVVVDTASLCATITDKPSTLELTTICPLHLTQPWKGLTIAPGSTQHVYGLGEQFMQPPGNTDGDWTGRKRQPGDSFGNQMVGFGNGMAGNAQFPVMYALGPNKTNYALFLDHIYKQAWDFTGNPWKVETWGDQIRWYVITGSDLPDLRQDYMEMTGRPPVPPKKMFGLWVSEYGYDSWAELEDKLGALRSDKFPIDGFVLDLQWFGGITRDSDNSSMGRLTWDTNRFPDPAGKLSAYKNAEGIAIIPIEESYISKGLAEHADLQNRGYLLRAGCDTCPPVYLTGNPWWGKGGMIDWTQDLAGDYWHDLKRQPLIQDGVAGHWIDLGEPEMYDPGDWAAGVLPNKHGHADYHNIYTFKWAESIARGYARKNVTRRPFLMARSGAAGIQRFGVSMWSGDIGSDLTNLASHLNAQLHMSMSGIDYFGSDIGGFRRTGDREKMSRIYTPWFANGMMLDVPGRPHTDNSSCPYPPSSPDDSRCKETAPNKIGDKASNLANVRQRYELSPYLYSLAHRAYLVGEPVIPPLVYYYQNDVNVRELGSEKLVGRHLLVATVTDENAAQRDVYLPAGDWVNYHTNEWLRSTGQVFAVQPLFFEGLFRLPTYARAGAIIPKMYVDDKTMNVLGRRTDGSTRDELIVRVYAAKAPTVFTLYEDDGESIAYQNGAVRSTAISQQLSGDGMSATVTLGPAVGSYDGAPTSRGNVVELVSDGAQAAEVTLNGSKLPQMTSRAAFDAANNGCFNAGKNLILAKSGDLNVAVAKTFVFTLVPVTESGVTATFECRNGNTVWGQSVYVVGNVPELGKWNPAKAVKLNPDGPYPAWTGVVKELPPSATIEWKCITRSETGDISRADMWQPGANNVLITPDKGDAGKTTGDFSSGGSAAVSVHFVCDNGTTVWGQSVYVVGNAAEMGKWAPAKAVKLEPTSYPRWTGTVILPADSTIEWRCIKRPENADSPVVWEPGANNVLTIPATGSVAGSGDFGH